MFCLPAGAKYPLFQAPSHKLYWRLKKISYRACLLFYYFFGDKKQLLRAFLTCTFIRLLLDSFGLRSCSFMYGQGRVFPFSCERLGRDLQETIASSFLKFSNSIQNSEFPIHRSHMKIGLSEVIKFCTRKLIKRARFMSQLKMINLFQYMMPNNSPKNVDLQVSRPATFMIKRTQLKPDNH